MSYQYMIVSSLLVGVMLITWIVRYAPDVKVRNHGIFIILTLFVVTGLIGYSGLIADLSRMPPPFFFYLAGITALGVAIAFSPWGKAMALATPLRVLVGMQAFRFMPETLLDLAWRDGLAPIQMTFHGRNFDIVTAIVSLVLFFVWPRLKNPLLWAKVQTVLGLALLLNILVIAILSAPLPFRVFMNEPANTFVGTFPYNWLPGIHVFAAWLIHLVTVRRIRLG